MLDPLLKVLKKIKKIINQNLYIASIYYFTDTSWYQDDYLWTKSHIEARCPVWQFY